MRMKCEFVFITCVLWILVVINGAKAGELNGLRRCCSKDFLNYTSDVRSGEYLCQESELNEEKQKFNIDCGENVTAEIIEFENVEDIRELSDDEYCFVGNNEAQNVFLVAICINEEQTQHHVALSIYFMPISFIFLVLTFLVYYKIKTLRAPEDIAFIISIVCLAVFILIRAPHHWFTQIEPIHDILSFLDLYIAHFALIGYFSWLNVIMANQLRKNMSSYAMSVSKKWIYLNHLYGWGIPTLVMLITIVNVIMDGARTEQEVISSQNYEYSEYIPIVILWLINCILLGLVLYFAINYPSEQMNRRVIRYRSWKYCQLFLVSGFLWIFEILSWLMDYSGLHTFFIITDCINALQGLFLFIVMVVLRLHVRRSLAGTRILCIKFPKTWSTLEDADDVELLPTENNQQMTTVVPF